MASTLEEVARLAGVSRSTVSRVINDHPSVRSETRERVWQAIRKSGYQPHALARSLVTNRTQIIGMVIPEAVTTLFTDPFFPILLRGATEACNEHGYQMMLSLFSPSADRQEIYQRLVRNAYLDGVIVASAGLNDPLISDLLRDGVPFVCVGRHPNGQVHYVDVDNAGGALMAVEHLIRLGHRRIGALSGRPDMAAGQDRLEGCFDYGPRWPGIKSYDQDVAKRIQTLVSGLQDPDAQVRLGVIDFLNQETSFLTLFQEDRILLVNKRRIARVAELDKEES